VIALWLAAAASEPVWVPPNPWPWALRADASAPLVCDVEVGVTARGRPDAPRVVDCPADLEALALRRVGLWRWPRTGEDQPRRVVKVVWPAAGDLTPMPTPQRWWWRDGQRCEARVTVGGAAAAPRVDRRSAGCDVLVAAVDVAPTGARRSPVVCPVTVVVVDGVAGPPDLFRCLPQHWGPARAALAAMSWTSPWPSTGWSVLLRFDAP
jgi:hypothetical protein